MDALSSVNAVVSQTLAVKDAGQRVAVDVSLMKAALELQKRLGAEIAAMLGVGSVTDIKA